MLFLATAQPIVQSSKNRIQFSNMMTEQYILYVQQVILSVFTFIDSFNRTMMNQRRSLRCLLLECPLSCNIVLYILMELQIDNNNMIEPYRILQQTVEIFVDYIIYCSIMYQNISVPPQAGIQAIIEMSIVLAPSWKRTDTYF